MDEESAALPVVDYLARKKPHPMQHFMLAQSLYDSFWKDQFSPDIFKDGLIRE